MDLFSLALLFRLLFGGPCFLRHYHLGQTRYHNNQVNTYSLQTRQLYEGTHLAKMLVKKRCHNLQAQWSDEALNFDDYYNNCNDMFMDLIVLRFLSSMFWIILRDPSSDWRARDAKQSDTTMLWLTTPPHI